MFQKNQKMFEKFKALNLPLEHYAITSSGVLGIRHLREMGDIDIIVDAKLWDTLAKKHGVVQAKNVKKIVLADGLVEVLGEESFTDPLEQNQNNLGPTIQERIAAAEIIDGMSFESLDNVIFFKQQMGREKDLKDLLLIETWKQKQGKK